MITTEHCKEYLNSNFETLTGLKQLPEWKRLNKTGKKGEPIIRRFVAVNYYPIIASVHEINGVISGVTFEPIASWTPGFEDLVMKHLNEKNPANVNFDPFDEYWQMVTEGGNLEGQFLKSELFYFNVMTQNLMGEDLVFIQIFPKVLWDIEHRWYDQHIGHIVCHLSDLLQDEEMECCFSVSGKNEDEVKKQLISEGFIYNPVNCMDDFDD